MPSNACKECGVRWPDEDGYRTCPRCGGRCSWVGRPQSVTGDEAAAELRYFRAREEFERQYAEREASRDGLTPEELGRRDARDWREGRDRLIRELEEMWSLPWA